MPDAQLRKTAIVTGAAIAAIEAMTSVLAKELRGRETLRANGGII
jgi:hypothetical protein